jgi:hypothetical protein
MQHLQEVYAESAYQIINYIIKYILKEKEYIRKRKGKLALATLPIYRVVLIFISRRCAPMRLLLFELFCCARWRAGSGGG